VITSTRGIFLHAVKYAETSLIASIYTEAFGRKSFVISGLRSKNSSMKAGIFQPLFLLDMETYFRPGKEILRIRNARILEPFAAIPFDIRKSTQVLFLSEVLYKCLREEEANAELFDFIYHALVLLDLSEAGISNFHLWFLLNLTKYLGIYPRNEDSQINNFFDMQSASFVSREPIHGQFADKRETALLARLFGVDSSSLESLGFSQHERKIILQKLLEFYQIHFDNLGTIKSLEILTDVLR
jgi:DNA repair protein RecO (recombination protein O)